MRNLVRERIGNRKRDGKRHTWKDNIKMDFDVVNWIPFDHDRWQLCTFQIVVSGR
jgi:hypothetical protein